MEALNIIPKLAINLQHQQLCSSSLRHQLTPPFRQHSTSSSSSSNWFSQNFSCVPVSASRNNNIFATMAPPSSKTIASTFADLKRNGKVALIPYITAGDPDLSTTAEALKLLDKCGADIIELGVPYSDPLADGPVIQAAATRALKKGTNLETVLKMVEEVAPQIAAPIVLFLYYNPIMKRGLDKFFREVKSAGVTGLLVPDIPLEETNTLRKMAIENGIELILLTTPTTPKQRMQEITNATQGFVYLVSLTGVTGARAEVNARVESLLHEIKMTTEKPVAVGFGISKPEHAVQVAKWGADGVIVGSAMVKLLGESSSPEEGLLKIRNLAQDITQSLLSL